MSQQIYNKNSEKNFDLKTHNSTLSTKSDVTQTETSPTPLIKVVKKTPISQRWKTHKFWLVRSIYYVLRSVWIIVMTIGAVIAWIISLLFI